MMVLSNIVDSGEFAFTLNNSQGSFEPIDQLVYNYRISGSQRFVQQEMWSLD